MAASLAIKERASAKSARNRAEQYASKQHGNASNNAVAASKLEVPVYVFSIIMKGFMKGNKIMKGVLEVLLESEQIV